mgnify:CR=1 FL=1
MSLGGAIIDSGNFDWTEYGDKFHGLTTPDEESTHVLASATCVTIAASFNRSINNTLTSLPPFKPNEITPHMKAIMKNKGYITAIMLGAVLIAALIVRVFFIQNMMNLPPFKPNEITPQVPFGIYLRASS